MPIIGVAQAWIGEGEEMHLYYAALRAPNFELRAHFLMEIPSMSLPTRHRDALGGMA